MPSSIVTRWAWVGGWLGIASGVLEFVGGVLIVFGNVLVGSVEFAPGGAGVAFLYFMSIPRGLLLIGCGVLVLLRKYTLGGILLLIFGVLIGPVAAPTVFWVVLGTPSSAGNLAWQVGELVLYWFLYALPVAGGILAILSGQRIVVQEE